MFSQCAAQYRYRLRRSDAHMRLAGSVVKATEEASAAPGPCARCLPLSRLRSGRVALKCRCRCRACRGVVPGLDRASLRLHGACTVDGRRFWGRACCLVCFAPVQFEWKTD
jgi:hypothetical protein